MKDKEPFLKGWMTISGVIVTLVGFLLGTEMAADLRAINEAVMEILPSILSVIGMGTSFYGRFRQKDVEYKP